MKWIKGSTPDKQEIGLYAVHCAHNEQVDDPNEHFYAVFTWLGDSWWEGACKIKLMTIFKYCKLPKD